METKNLLEQYQEQSAKLANLHHKAKMAHEKVKQVKAELVQAALNDPSVCAGGKATVAAIESFYRQQDYYIIAKEAQIDAELEYETCIQKLDSLNFEKDISLRSTD